jgi:ABC-type transporter Mla maintaining outer membrane lipid asymmetry ATPase subunit MlaF
MKHGSTETLVEVSEIRLHPDAPAISFRLQRGESLSFLGGNGCGKSRLLAALIGQTDSGGRVAIGGKDINHPHERKAARSRIGILFQENGLLRDLNVFDNIGLPARVRGRPKGEDATRVTEILLGLSRCGHLRSAYPSEISGGDARRVALVRCLAGESDILILDEPVIGLSSGHRKAMTELLVSLKNEGVIAALIVLTNDPDVAAQLTDRHIPLRRKGECYGIPGHITPHITIPSPAAP